MILVDRCLCTITGNAFWGGTPMKLNGPQHAENMIGPSSTLAPKIAPEARLQRDDRMDVPCTMVDYVTIF
jgi:hypothetical protein